MRILRSIIIFLQPKFLARVDKYLLLNYPRLWIAKIHYILFYGVLANLVLNGLVFVFIQPRQLYSFAHTTVWFIIIPELLIFLYWFYSQLLFNVEADYGNTHYTAAWTEIIVYLTGLIIIFSSSLTAQLTGIYKAGYILGINSQTNCYSPLLGKFYRDGLPSDEYLPALALAESAVKAGTITEDGNLSIENDAITAEESEIKTMPVDSGLYVYKGETLIVERGEATLTLDYFYSQQGTTTVKHTNETIVIEDEKPILLRAGDEITVNDTAYIKVIEGTIGTRHKYTATVNENSAIIIEEGEKLRLVTGPTTITTNSRFFKFPEERNYDTCLGLKYYLTNREIYHQYGNSALGSLNIKGDLFIVEHYKSWNAILIFTGILVLTLLKHVGGQGTVMTIAYWLFQLVISGAVITGIGYGLYYLSQNVEVLNANELTQIRLSSALNIATIFSAIPFGILQYIHFSRAMKEQRYKRITFLRILSLPTEVTLVLLITLFTLLDLIFDAQLNPSALKLILILILITYLVVQKRVLIYLMSLPRG